MPDGDTTDSRPRVKILLTSTVGRQWAALVRKMIRTTLRIADFGQPCEVSVRLTDDGEIRSLNREHRNIDAATDVLSFPLDADRGPDGRVWLGDLVISVETAERRAALQQWPLDAEMALLTAHGVLHLLGHDHQALGERRDMRRHEAAALSKAGFDPALVGR